MDGGPEGQANSRLASSPFDPNQGGFDFGTTGTLNTRDQPGFDFSERTEEAAAATDPEPSEAQIEAGNYRKGKVTLHGLPISIENARGSIRSGTDGKGKAWSVELAHHYGYFLGTEARDGGHVNVFVGPNPESTKAFVVNQIRVDSRRFDEHKVMLGFNSRKEAIAGYLANYAPGWKGLGDMVETDVAALKEWLKGDTTKPAKKDSFAESQPMVLEKPTALPAPSSTGGLAAIADFGEKIGGAKKDLWSGFREAIAGTLPANMAEFTMAKNFPEPNWQKLIDSGISPENVAALKAVRDMVPRKPGSSYKIHRWAELVTNLHGIAQKIAGGEMDLGTAESRDIIAKYPTIGRQVLLYVELGMPAIIGAKDWTLNQGAFNQYRNLTAERGRNVDVMYAEFKGRSMPGSEGDFYGLANDPDTIDKIVAAVRAKIEAESGKAPEKKQTEFSVYRERFGTDHFIGKKMPGRPVIRLKGGFETARDTFDYLKENRDALESQWAALRKDPVMRRESNMAREGPDRRDGDVTPEMFKAAFGFRGVEFGNWVAGGERQGSCGNDRFNPRPP